MSKFRLININFLLNVKLKKIIDKNPALLLGLILILGFVIYYPSTKFQFLINFDDDTLILNSPEIQSLNWENVKYIFAHTKDGLYHPITSLTWQIEHYFFKLDPFYYHLDNLLIHLLSVFLVFLFIKTLFKDVRIALFSALLFTIHPMHVENISWISSRKDLVYGIFFLLSLFQYSKYKQEGKNWHFLLSILFFVLSLLSKANAVVLPALFLLIDWFVGDKNWKKNSLTKIPLFGLSIAFVILTINAQQSAGFIADTSFTYNIVDRIFMLAASLLHYLSNFVLPFNLAPKNFYPEKTAAFLPWFYYASIPILGLIAFFTFKSKHKKYLLFGFLFLGITLGPVLKIIPTGNDLVSNRYAYMPYIGLYAVLGYFIFNLKKTWLNTFAFILIVAFGVKSYSYQFTYKDSLAVWTKIIEISNGNKWATAMSYNERGQVYLKYRNQTAALKDITQALKIEPTLLRGLMNRANIYELNNQLDLALKDLNKAIEIEPDQVEALRIRSVIHGKMQHPKLAITDLDRAISLSPQRADLYNNRGIANAILGNNEAAKKDFSKAIALDQFYFDPYVNRANLHIELQEIKLAQQDLAFLYQKNPDHFIYAYLIAKTHLMQNNEDKAHAFLAPFAKDEMMAGQVAEHLANDGYYAQSLPYFTIAIGNESIREKSLYQRANSYRELGNYQNAIDDLMAILEKMPNPQFFFEIGNLYHTLENNSKACEFWNEGAIRNHEACKASLTEYCQ